LSGTHEFIRHAVPNGSKTPVLTAPRISLPLHGLIPHAKPSRATFQVSCVFFVLLIGNPSDEHGYRGVSLLLNFFSLVGNLTKHLHRIRSLRHRCPVSHTVLHWERIRQTHPHPLAPRDRLFFPFSVLNPCYNVVLPIAKHRPKHLLFVNRIFWNFCTSGRKDRLPVPYPVSSYRGEGPQTGCSSPSPKSSITHPGGDARGPLVSLSVQAPFGRMRQLFHLIPTPLTAAGVLGLQKSGCSFF